MGVADGADGGADDDAAAVDGRALGVGDDGQLDVVEGLADAVGGVAGLAPSADGDLAAHWQDFSGLREPDWLDAIWRKKKVRRRRKWWRNTKWFRCGLSN